MIELPHKFHELWHVYGSLEATMDVADGFLPNTALLRLIQSEYDHLEIN